MQILLYSLWSGRPMGGNKIKSFKPLALKVVAVTYTGGDWLQEVSNIII